MPTFRIYDKERDTESLLVAQDAEDALLQFVKELGYSSLRQAADRLGLSEHRGSNISVEEIEEGNRQTPRGTGPRS
jgi:hypothetical protein